MKSRNRKHSNILTSVLLAALVMIIALFFFIPYITEKYTIKSVIKHSIESVDKIKITRAYYVDAVVDDIKKFAPNIEFDYDHEGVNGKIPLPTTTIHDLSKLFSEQTGTKYNLYSDFPFKNREERVLTEFQKDAIKFTKESPDGLYIKRDVIDGQEVLRVATTDFMTDSSCVSCHNRHADKTWQAGKWKLGDKRGVLEVITPLSTELSDHAVMRNVIILFVVAIFTIILLYIYLQIRHREEELIDVADELESEVNSKRRELKTLSTLLDKNVISSKTDKNGRITYVSEAFLKISGYTESELLNQNHSLIRHPDMGEEIFNEMWQTIKNGDNWSGEIKNRTKNGDFYWVYAVISPNIDKKGNIIGYSAVRQDITAEKKASYLALHDHLTKLPNRASFEAKLEIAIESADTYDEKLAVLFIDLDNFKDINDTLGHTIGDKLLIEISSRVQNLLKDNDRIARISGDEFIVLLEAKKSKEEITQITENILEVIREVVVVDANSVYTTASIGVSVYPEDGKNITELMKNADTAMYFAKDSAKDSFKYYTKNILDSMYRRINVEKALRRAIENDGFKLVFQPKYQIKSNKIISCEALLRLEDVELGHISPSEFIPIAEENKMIGKIGNIVLEKSCCDFKRMRESGLDIQSIAINLSSYQLEQEDAVEYILSIIKRANLSPSDVELELTEYTIMGQSGDNAEALNTLRDAGVKISIDDFGTGYSSMAYLKSLPVDTIKIDKVFVDNITTNSDDKEIAKAIIALSNSLGYEVLAEGIESKAQEKVLMELGCHLGQGFLYSKGLELEEFIKFES